MCLQIASYLQGGVQSGTNLVSSTYLQANPSGPHFERFLLFFRLEYHLFWDINPSHHWRPYCDCDMENNNNSTILNCQHCSELSFNNWFNQFVVITIPSFSHLWLRTKFVTRVTRGVGTDYSFGAHEFTPAASGVRVAQSVLFCVVFCRSLFVLFPLAIALSAPSSICDVWITLWNTQTFFQIDSHSYSHLVNILLLILSMIHLQCLVVNKEMDNYYDKKV